MNFEISLEGDSVDQINYVKEDIDRESIEGIYSLKIEKEMLQRGQMTIDGGVLNSIKGIVEAASKPLVELVKVLQKYADNYRTPIKIKLNNGTEVTLSHGKSMTPDQLEKFVNSIINKSEN